MILYYYHKDGNTLGPVTMGELKAMLESDEISPETPVCLFGKEDWEPLRTILAKAQTEESSPPSFTSPRVIAKAIAGVVHDVRARMNDADQPKPLARWINDPTSPHSAIKRKPMKLRRLFALSNLLLAAIAILLLILCFASRNPPQPTYEYKWMHVSREDFRTVYDFNRHDPDTYKFELDGWEYVGPLCNDGINASYILLRRAK